MPPESVTVRPGPSLWSLDNPLEPSYKVSLCQGLEVAFLKPNKMPNRFHRLMHRIFFGFRYTDLTGRKDGK